MVIIDHPQACLIADEAPPLSVQSEDDSVLGVDSVAVCLMARFFDGRDIVLPLFMPFMTWLRINFRERRSMAELSTNSKDIVDDLSQKSLQVLDLWSAHGRRDLVWSEAVSNIQRAHRLRTYQIKSETIHVPTSTLSEQNLESITAALLSPNLVFSMIWERDFHRCSNQSAGNARPVSNYEESAVKCRTGCNHQ